MSDLSNVLTQERRAAEKGCCSLVLAACGLFVTLGTMAAVGFAYPTIGRIVGALFVTSACVLIGFDVGRRFERRSC